MHWTSTTVADTIPAPKGMQWINPIYLASDCQRISTWSWWQTFKRNPFANFNSFVLGVSHHPRLWISTIGFSNFPVKGFGFTWLIADSCLFPRPWLCYRGTSWECGIGWKCHGGFGINLRHANSPNASVVPPT